MFDRLVARWTGVALTVIGVAATITLVLTGQLTLYIHPRYTVFTTVMAVLAGLACLMAVVVLPRGATGAAPTDPAARSTELAHRHSHEHAPRPPTGRGTARLRRLSSVLRVLIVASVAVGLLVVPPATLTAATMQNRDVASSTRVRAGTDVPTLVGSDPLTLSVKDWAGLLEQGGAEAVLDKPVRVSGFVLDRGDDSVFFAARMLVTCCAVDGQPVGIPVQRAGWRTQFQPGDWVELQGNFVENSDSANRYDIVVDIASVSKIAEPQQPYVY